MVLLLGAGRGLGRSLLRFFLGQQVPVSCVTRTNDSLTSIRREFSKSQHGLKSEAFDLADRECTQSMIDSLAAGTNSAGFPVLVVYTAGFLSGRLNFLDEKISDIDREIEINFRAPLYWSWLLSRHFVERGKGGHVFISSGVAPTPRPHWGGYGIAKGALEALSAQLALDLPPPLYSLTLNPGGMATDMRRLAYPEEDPTTLPTADATGEKIGRFCLSLIRDGGRRVNGKRLQIGDLP